MFLSTNYHKLEVPEDFKLHRYSIKVSPEAKGRKLVQIIKDALSLPAFGTLRSGFFSDCAAFLLSCEVIPDHLLKVSVPYKKDTGVEGQSGTTSLVATNFVVFDYIRTVDVNNDPINQQTADQGSLPMVQDLDIVLGHYRKSSDEIAMIGRQKAFRLETNQRPWDNFDARVLASQTQESTAVLIAVRGFYSSVRLSTTGILVNINVTHGPFYIRRNLANWYGNVRNSLHINISKIPNLLKGVRVSLIHLSSQKSVVRTILGYASPGQGRHYEAHPPLVSSYGAGPQDVEFFQYESNQPAMGPDEREQAKNGRLPPHKFPSCGCKGSYISVSKYFKKSIQMPVFLDMT